MHINIYIDDRLYAGHIFDIRDAGSILTNLLLDGYTVGKQDTISANDIRYYLYKQDSESEIEAKNKDLTWETTHHALWFIQDEASNKWTPLESRKEIKI